MSPVTALPANDRGFHDVFGNAWDWTSKCLLVSSILKSLFGLFLYMHEKLTVTLFIFFDLQLHILAP